VPGGLGDRQQFQVYYEGPIKMAQKKDVNETALGKVCCCDYCAFLQQWRLEYVSQGNLNAETQCLSQGLRYCVTGMLCPTFKS